MDSETLINCPNCHAIINIGNIKESQNEAVAESKFKEEAIILEAKAEAVSQLVHECSDPIYSVLLNSEQLVNRIQREEAHTLTNRNSYVDYCEDIIKNMLFLKYLLSGYELIYKDKATQRWLNLERCRIKDILLYAIKLLERNAFEKGLWIRTNISALPDLIIDREKIMQVFFHLLKNAINYSNKQREVEIFYKQTEETFIENSNCSKWHEIKFVNYGVGILESEKEDIFMLYRRGSNTAISIYG